MHMYVLTLVMLVPERKARRSKAGLQEVSGVSCLLGQRQHTTDSVAYQEAAVRKRMQATGAQV